MLVLSIVFKSTPSEGANVSVEGSLGWTGHSFGAVRQAASRTHGSRQIAIRFIGGEPARCDVSMTNTNCVRNPPEARGIPGTVRPELSSYPGPRCRCSHRHGACIFAPDRS